MQWGKNFSVCSTSIFQATSSSSLLSDNFNYWTFSLLLFLSLLKCFTSTFPFFYFLRIAPPCNIQLSNWRTVNLEHAPFSLFVMNVHKNPLLHPLTGLGFDTEKPFSSTYTSYSSLTSSHLSPSPLLPLVFPSFCRRQTPSGMSREALTCGKSPSVQIPTEKETGLCRPISPWLKLQLTSPWYSSGAFLSAQQDLEKQDKERGKLFH